MVRILNGVTFQGDVHLESGGRVAFLDDNESHSDDDALILNGDFCPFVRDDLWKSAVRDLAQKFARVYWVPGNHEYFGPMPMEEAAGYAMRQMEPDNVHVVDCDTFTAHNTTFAACTLWAAPTDPLIARMIGDFRWIPGMTLEYYNELHQVHRDWLLDQECDVYVTHHAPRSHGVASPHYDGNRNHTFFGTEILPHVPHPPKAWLYGHTHWNMCRPVGRTMLQTAHERRSAVVLY